METSILTTLERAELAARERTLAASGEAEAILAAARADARAIAAGVEARAADAIAERRTTLLEAAAAEALALEAEAAAEAEAEAAEADEVDGNSEGGRRAEPAGASPRDTDAAAERIVRAVLGEA